VDRALVTSARNENLETVQILLADDRVDPSILGNREIIKLLSTFVPSNGIQNMQEDLKSMAEKVPPLYSLFSGRCNSHNTCALITS
jgi:hypothetical protein